MGDPIPNGIVGRAPRVVNMPHDPVIVIPVYEDVDVLDVTGPFEMFRWANIEVRSLPRRVLYRAVSARL